MNSLVSSLLAAGCASLSGLLFRKNADNSTTNYQPSGYLVLFYFFSFILSLIFNPYIWKGSINFLILATGMCVGLLNIVLMLLTFKALKLGPVGLTSAFQNASAIFPGLILFLLLGSNFGFSCSLIQWVGMGVVLFGLFLGAKEESSGRSHTSSQWLKYALACFILQIFALTLIQGRCALFECGSTAGLFSFFKPPIEADDAWFMPGQFGAAFAVQAILFLSEKKKFQKSEVIYGCLSGVFNFSSTMLLLLATKFALPFEKAILFPCFAVASMILCNVWANRLYHEKFNLKTNALCSFGIFMASV